VGKVKVVSKPVKVKTYSLLMDCIERGLEIGWNHAHKYSKRPTKDQIWISQGNEIGVALDEYFEFE
jgi:hypothetical protein